MTRNHRVIYSAIACLVMGLSGMYLVHNAHDTWDMLTAVLLLIVACFTLCMVYLIHPRDSSLRKRCDELHETLVRIADMRTSGANATVRRMADAAQAVIDDTPSSKLS